jgi:hypothetical protein
MRKAIQAFQSHCLQAIKDGKDPIRIVESDWPKIQQIQAADSNTTNNSCDPASPKQYDPMDEETSPHATEAYFDEIQFAKEIAVVCAQKDVEGATRLLHHYGDMAAHTILASCQSESTVKMNLLLPQLNRHVKGAPSGMVAVGRRPSLFSLLNTDHPKWARLLVACFGQVHLDHYMYQV